MADFQSWLQPLRAGRGAAKSTFPLLVPLCAPPVAAHEILPAVADVTVNTSEARIELVLTLEPLVAGLDLAGLADTSDSPLAARYDRLRARDARLTPEIVSIEVRPAGDTGLPRDAALVLTALLPDGGLIATVFATVGYWFGRKRWYRAVIAVPASAPIASVGAHWSIQRVFF